MKLSRLLAIALLAVAAVQARDYAVPLSSSTKKSKTYYSYSYNPTRGSSVHASGFTHGGGAHLNGSTTAASSSTISSWKSKANSAASKLSGKIKLPTGY